MKKLYKETIEYNKEAINIYIGDNCFICSNEDKSLFAELIRICGNSRSGVAKKGEFI